MQVYQTGFSPQYVREIQKRVDRGAKLLDKKVGLDWFRKIKTGVLALSDPFMCVLGQTFAKEAEQADETGFDFGSLKLQIEDKEARYGFNLDSSDTFDYHARCPGGNNSLNPWTLLGETWLAKIRQLKRERSKIK